MFYKWARGAHPARYKAISESWVETIRPATGRGMHSEFQEHKFYTLEQIRKIAALKPTNLKEERDQAAICLLFLSAMRSQAFVSMPLGALDLERCVVSQFPELGVRTKNRKAARTQLLRIPELLTVVRAWDQRLRAAGLGDEDIWFQALDAWHANPSGRRDLNWLARRAVLADGLRDLCEMAGVPYLSPHKLRHGHAVYMMKRVKDMRQLKSLSQNLMHTSVAITDGTYGRLVSDDIAEMYSELGG
jgi:integrase